MKTFLFTSESVSEGHPDKVADQISDAVLDEFLRRDPQSHVACETLCTTGLVAVCGEVNSEAYVDVQGVARDVIERIGYTKSEYKFDSKSCGFILSIHSQSDDINMGVDKSSEAAKAYAQQYSDASDEQGAGDQGMMFGYACDETPEYMPLPISLAHKILRILSDIRHEGKVMTYLRPDAKSQFTVKYDADSRVPVGIDTIVLSTQHDPDVDAPQIKADVEKYVIPALKESLPANVAALFVGYRLLVNPTGKFVLGGPYADTGLTGRKIIVDTYGGRGAHGGGAFSGKDPSKVDRSAAYAARYLAKNLVAAGVCKEALVQLSYAIGVAEPVSIYVNTNGTAVNGIDDSLIASILPQVMSLKPSGIIGKFGLKNPIYEPTATYGHMGRESYVKEVEMISDGVTRMVPVRFFGWEMLDGVQTIKSLLKI